MMQIPSLGDPYTPKCGLVLPSLRCRCWKDLIVGLVKVGAESAMAKSLVRALTGQGR